MLEKHRSLRETLTSKIKESVFTVFSKNILPPINTKPIAEGSDIFYMA
ncbi:7388_t:CDS:2 [Funneliformis geosporum]|uniref:15371_t:CDS:1 n=1 Tax=Funneliformis geosporum TaxID=1117311 RepID=A0A9W4WTV0_9GLOM|nr:15371_t:CDS:2 [Funneliformis geosporum]CAI2201411.1 7388_t:CDS:2 [Funneliformis geosporum]